MLHFVFYDREVYDAPGDLAPISYRVAEAFRRFRILRTEVRLEVDPDLVCVNFPAWTLPRHTKMIIYVTKKRHHQRRNSVF